jgi:hypothetical protein
MSSREHTERSSPRRSSIAISGVIDPITQRVVQQILPNGVPVSGSATGVATTATNLGSTSPTGFPTSIPLGTAVYIYWAVVSNTGTVATTIALQDGTTAKMVPTTIAAGATVQFSFANAPLMFISAVNALAGTAGILNITVGGLFG